MGNRKALADQRVQIKQLGHMRKFKTNRKNEKNLADGVAMPLSSRMILKLPGVDACQVHMHVTSPHVFQASINPCTINRSSRPVLRIGVGTIACFQEQGPTEWMGSMVGQDSVH